MRQRLGTLILLTGLFCGLGAVTRASAATYRIGMVHWVAWSPLNVAEAQGFFAKQGVDVKVVNFSDQKEMEAALVNRRIDLCMDMMGSFVSLNEEAPVTIVGELDWSHGGDKIIARKNLNLKQVRGKQVGVYQNSAPISFFLSKYLATGGVKLKEVKVVELQTEPLADQFIAGRLDLTVNYDPQALRQVSRGGGKVVATSATWPGVIPEGLGGLAARVKSIPDKDLVAIFKAWNQAVKWQNTPANWKAYAKVLNAKTFEGEPPYGDADLKGMLQSVRVHSPATLKDRNRPGGGVVQYLTQLRTFLKENGLLKKDFSPTTLFNGKALLGAL